MWNKYKKGNVKMNKFDAQNIEDLGFIKTDFKGSEANIYVNENKGICYKRFKDKNLDYLKDKQMKLELLSNLKELEEAVLPLDEGYDYKTDLLDGYTMKFYEHAINMYELSKFTSVFELRKFFMAVLFSSRALKRIHERAEKIVIGDASYQNLIILTDPNGLIEKSLCIDFDSVEVGNIDCKYKSTSELLSSYFSSLGILEYNQSQNTDRLTRLLYFLNSFFALNIKELPLYEYDKKCELSNTLKNLRSIITELKKVNTPNEIPYIPYMHEVLDLTDAYELSRKL